MDAIARDLEAVGLDHEEIDPVVAIGMIVTDAIVVVAAEV
jgi:oligoribonuclease (3'-5' exoribonuclease)